MITPDQNQRDFVIYADNSTTLVAFNFKIDSKKINSIIIDHQSTCTFTNSEITNFKTAANVQNESKLFFLNCSIQNTQVIQNSQFLEIINKSRVQAVDCNFQKCCNDAINVSTSSFLNISHCSFSQFDRRLMNFQDKSNWTNSQL
jgi:hypothetical protein